MATKARRVTRSTGRSTNRQRTSVEDRAEEAATRAFLGWFRFTWATDTQRLRWVPLPHAAANWLFAAALLWGWVTMWRDQWHNLLALSAGAFLYSIGRAARVLRGHRRASEALVAATAVPCRHPRAALADPASLVTVTRWSGAERPDKGTVKYAEGSAASQRMQRWQAEKAIESAAKADETSGIVFDWSRPGLVGFQRLPLTDPQTARKKRARWIDSVVASLFPPRRGTAEEIEVVCDWDEDDLSGPATVIVQLGTYDVADRGFRERAEAVFDAKVAREGHAWLYDWSTVGQVTITAAAVSSGDVTRRMTSRKVGAVLVGAAAKCLPYRASNGVEVQVTRWVPEDRPQPNSPVEIQLDFGTADFSSIEDQRRFEGLVDQALETDWPDRVWIPQWRFGSDSTVTLSAVPVQHEHALRKAELARLRSVTGDHFRVPRGATPVGVEVLEWLSSPGVEQARKIVVSFGTYDVTALDTRRQAETHFDSISDDDWSFQWEPTAGRVTMTAVPPVPDYIPFPAPETPEHERWHQEFRNGRIILGPAKGGREAVIDLNKLPHTLVGGATGAGKSVLITLALYGVLMNPESINIVIVDPKVTDFNQYANYPGVVMFGINDVSRLHEELSDISAFVVGELNRRRKLCQAYGCRDLQTLRRKCAAGNTPGLELWEIPVRLIVLFDEAKAAFVKVTDEAAREFQVSSKTDFEKLGLLARALEINLLMAAQKPTAEDIGTSIRSQCGNRIAVGLLNSIESKQVLDNNLATFLEGAPKGRGVMVDATGQELQFQTYWLPDDTTQDLLHPDQHVVGAVERIHESLTEQGWTTVYKPHQVTIDVEGEEREVVISRPHWVRPGAPVDFDVE